MSRIKEMLTDLLCTTGFIGAVSMDNDHAFDRAVFAVIFLVTLEIKFGRRADS